MTTPESPPAEAAPPPALTGSLKDFWAGLSTTSGASWVGILLFALAEFLACCIYLTPSRIVTIDPRWLKESRGDDYVALSQEMLAYRNRSLDKIQIAYIGASQATNALTLAAQKNPATLSMELTEATGGVPVEFQRFSSMRQRREDALLITDQFPKSFRGIVVLMISDYQDDYETVSLGERFDIKHGDAVDEDVRTQETRFSDRILAPDAPSLVPVWALRGVKRRNTGIFFVDHLVFFSARRLAGIPLPEHAPHLAARMRDGGRIKKAWRHLNRREFFTRVPLLTTSREVVATLMDNMKARGVKVILLEAPSNPIRDDLDTVGRLDGYRRGVTQLAEEHGAVYWDLNEDADLKKADFADAVHLGSVAGRERFQALLIERLAAAVNESFPNEPRTVLPPKSDAVDPDVSTTDDAN